MKASIVIPAKNEEMDIRDCLESVSKQSYRRFEVIVVDGSSSDGTVRVAKALGARVIPERPAVSPANARNIGARAAKGEILLFVDADNVLPKDHLSKVVAAFKNGIDALCTYTAPYRPNSIAKCFFQERAATYPRGSGITKMIPNAWRKAFFLKLGGYNPNLGYGEDKELNSRALQAGVKKVFRRRVVIYHKEPSSWGRIYREGRWWGRTLPSYIKSDPKRGAVTVMAVLFRAMAIPAAILTFLLGMGAISIAITVPYLAYYAYLSCRSYRENPSAYSAIMPLFKSLRNVFVLAGVLEALLKRAFGMAYSKGE